MQEGTVKFFNASKGFGFITPNNGGADVFVHITGVNGDLYEQDKVTYDVEEGRKGLNAINVRVTN
jgi:CspA family cold shock protein